MESFYLTGFSAPQGAQPLFLQALQNFPHFGQGNALLPGDAGGIFIFYFALGRAITMAGLDAQRAIGGLHLLYAAGKRIPLANRPAHAQSCSVFENGGGEGIRIGYLANAAQQNARPALLHLDGQRKDIQRALP